MNSGVYAACAGLVARTQALDLAANNLANVNTTGFRGQQPEFRSMLAQSSGRLVSAEAAAVNDFGVVGGFHLDLTQGNLERTGNPLDVGIEGPGFLAVQTADGVRYTRNGNLRVSSDNRLLTQEGDAVLGEQGSVTLPSGEVSISADGTISVGGALAGRLKIVEFDSATQITQAGQSYYSAPSAAVRPAARTSVRQGMLESSNVNSVSAAVSLIALQRHAEMLNRTLSTFHSEFNRMAAEDLPRV